MPRRRTLARHCRPSWPRVSRQSSRRSPRQLPPKDISDARCGRPSISRSEPKSDHRPIENRTADARLNRDRSRERNVKTRKRQLLPRRSRPIEWPAVPGYEILGVLGRGGMAVVFKARQLELQRIVALKMLRNWARAGEQELARFRAEADVIARLQHPNIVQIYDVGEVAGRPYFVLEYRRRRQPGAAPQRHATVGALGGAICRSAGAGSASGACQRRNPSRS